VSAPARCPYALAVYSKARSSELESLTAADVDLAHGTITIARQADRASKGRKGTKQTKTRRVRTIDIEPNILPLVEWLVKHPDGKAGRLLHMPPPEDRAELLRKDLRLVGVTREALHIERDPSRRAIVFHDLRDTGLTHMAVRGDSPILIQWAGGHTDFKTTQGYIERGQTERRRIGDPLPPLPSDLFEASDGPPSNSPESPQGDSDDANMRESKAFLRPQRELNPCYRRERPVS
jgi:integrase